MDAPLCLSVKPDQIPWSEVLLAATQNTASPRAVGASVRSFYAVDGFDRCMLLAEYVIDWYAVDRSGLAAELGRLANDPAAGEALTTWAIETAYAYRTGIVAVTDAVAAERAGVTTRTLVDARDVVTASTPRVRRLRWLDDGAEAMVRALPLVPLAEDLATGLDFGLAVGFMHGTLAAGATSPGVILLDPTSSHLEQTWAHELAHQLDPRLRVDRSASLERFAEVLTPLLLTHQPATVADAAPLVVAAAFARPLDLEPDPEWLIDWMSWRRLPWTLVPAPAPTS